MKSRSRHNSTKKKDFRIFFTMRLRFFIKYHSPPYFQSCNITKDAETHPPPIRDVIIEQPQRSSSVHDHITIFQ